MGVRHPISATCEWPSSTANEGADSLKRAANVARMSVSEIPDLSLCQPPSLYVIAGLDPGNPSLHMKFLV
jgi:hypothetical protein